MEADYREYLREDIQNMVKVVPDHPKPGIMYQDMASIFNTQEGIGKCMTMIKDWMYETEIAYEYNRIVGLDARGFVLAGALSADMGRPFAMARKKGKLPGETLSTKYELEYGTDELHLQTDSVLEGDRVLVVDDVIATGGTLEAATSLIERMKAETIGIVSIMDLTFLGGSDKLKSKGYKVYSILKE
ncbi:MAG: adenine phosphoribosyltransferase [Candidatus Endolissoclinum sp. TMED37]|nr:MAG: adenine phosphoribosyltransferase [Candidatus Endolissoclinum sp. TMED37]